VAKFADRFNREWLVELDVAGFERVQKETGVDLQAVVDELGALGGRTEQIGALTRDPVRLVRVLWVLCERQAANKAPAVAPEEFGRGFGGDAVEDASGALLDELVSFTPRRVRELLRAGLAQVKQERDAATAKLLAAIEAGALRGDTPSTPATSAPVSSEPTPAPPG
jgi:hypothetical protein